MGEQGALGRGEQAWLRLVFGGPVSWWVPLARFLGVRVSVPSEVDDVLLAEAEAGAVLAVRRFWPGLLAATLGVAGLLAWLPIEARMLEVLTHDAFHTISDGLYYGGSPAWVGTLLASVTVIVGGILVGLGNAIVFGGLPMVLLRRCARAAAPAVGVTMAQHDDAFAAEQAERYPRLAFAARHLLYPRTGWRRA